MIIAKMSISYIKKKRNKVNYEMSSNKTEARLMTKQVMFIQSLGQFVVLLFFRLRLNEQLQHRHTFN